MFYVTTENNKEKSMAKVMGLEGLLKQSGEGKRSGSKSSKSKGGKSRSSSKARRAFGRTATKFVGSRSKGGYKPKAKVVKPPKKGGGK